MSRYRVYNVVNCSCQFLEMKAFWSRFYSLFYQDNSYFLVAVGFVDLPRIGPMKLVSSSSAADE